MCPTIRFSLAIPLFEHYDDKGLFLSHAHLLSYNDQYNKDIFIVPDMTKFERLQNSKKDFQEANLV